MSLAEGLDKLEGVRQIRLAVEGAHKVIGRVTYASGSSKDITYGILGEPSIDTTAYKRRVVLRNPGFRILGR